MSPLSESQVKLNLYCGKLEERITQLEAELQSARVTIATLSNHDTVRALTESMEDVKAGRCVRFEDMDRVGELEAALREAGKDTERLDWLSDNLAYPMMVNRQTNVMYTLTNNGRGWDGNELREAIDVAREAIAKETKT